MTTQRFAPWVEPLAERYDASRAEAVRVARSLGDDELRRDTGDTGWSVRDELTHIAALDGDFLKTLGAVLRGDVVDTSVFADIDGRNARNLAERRGRSMDQIADDLESDGAALRDLLARLTADDEARTPEGFPFALKQLVEGYAQHEPYHLGQIRDALAGAGPAREATT